MSCIPMSKYNTGLIRNLIQYQTDDNVKIILDNNRQKIFKFQQAYYFTTYSVINIRYQHKDIKFSLSNTKPLMKCYFSTNLNQPSTFHCSISRKFRRNTIQSVNTKKKVRY